MICVGKARAILSWIIARERQQMRTTTRWFSSWKDGPSLSKT